MKVLLTGAAGFIGSHLAERLCAQGHQVVGLDNFDPFYPRALKQRNLAGLLAHAGSNGRGRFELVEGDVGVPGDLTRAFSAGAGAGPVDMVIHLAALAGIAASLAAPERFFEVNVMGTMRLIEAAKRAGVTRFIFASSSSVYGADSPLPFREDAACASPLSPYAASKRAAELLAYGAHHRHQMAATSLRFFTVYGPRQRPDLAIHKFANLITSGQPIELHGDGSSERDYTYVDDIVDGVMAAVAQQLADLEPRNRIYNLGGSRAVPLARLVALLAGALGTPPQIVWRPDRPEDMRRTLADVRRARAELGYQPRVSLEDGLARFVNWWRGEEAGRGEAGLLQP